MGEDQAAQEEDHAAEAVVELETPHGRPIVRPQAPPVDALLEDAVGQRRGRDEGREDAVLVQPGNHHVADQGDAVAQGVAGDADRHVGMAEANRLESGFIGKQPPDVRQLQKTLHDLPVLGRLGPIDALAQQHDRYPPALGDQRRHFDVQFAGTVLREVDLALHVLEQVLFGLHLADQGFADPGRAEPGQHGRDRLEQPIGLHAHARRLIDAASEH